MRLVQKNEIQKLRAMIRNQMICNKRNLLCICIISLLVLSSVVFPPLSFAQDRPHRVENIRGEGIPFANVLFKNLPDSTLISVAVTDTLGYYEPDDSISGEILIEVYSLGYAHFCTRVEMPPPSTLVLFDNPEVLNPVIISSEIKKIYTSNNNTIITHVGDSPLSKLNRLSDVIIYVPFVSKNGSSYSVIGRGDPDIYIDGRKVRNQEELQLISADNIDRIELIMTPGSEYGATVEAVIKVFTKKRREGLCGSVTSSSYYLNKQPSGAFSSDLFYKHGNWIFFSTLSSAYTQVCMTSENKMMISEPNGIGELSSLMELLKRPALYTSIGCNYYSSKTGVNCGGQYTFYYVPKEESLSDITGNVMNAEMGDYVFQAQNKMSNLHFLHQFDGYCDIPITIGTNLHIEGCGESSENKSYYDIVETIKGSEGNQYVINNGYSFDFLAGKAKISHNLEQLAIEYGLDLSHTLYNSANIGSLQVNSHTSRTQTNEALFFSFGLQNKRCDVQSGLRVERHLLKYETMLYENNNDIDSRHLFPFLSFSYNPYDKLSVGLAYKCGITYPRYYQLRESIEYNTPLLYKSGNGSLLPSLNHSVSVDFSLYNFRLNCNYKYVKNAFFTIWTVSDNPFLAISYPINVPEMQNLTVGLFWSKNIMKWTPIFNLHITKPFLTYKGLSYLSPTVNVDIQNIIQLNKVIQAYINASYSSGGHQGVVLNKPNGNFQIGLSAECFQKKLKVYAYITDLFLLSKESSQIICPGFLMDNEYVNGMNNGLMLSVSYSFNSAPGTHISTSAGQDERGRLQ